MDMNLIQKSLRLHNNLGLDILQKLDYETGHKLPNPCFLEMPDNSGINIYWDYDPNQQLEIDVYKSGGVDIFYADKDDPEGYLEWSYSISTNIDKLKEELPEQFVHYASNLIEDNKQI